MARKREEKSEKEEKCPVNSVNLKEKHHIISILIDINLQIFPKTR